MSYTSPIKLNTIPEMEDGWTDKIAKYIAGETDKLILESCIKVKCDINEAELIKALEYDRGQYEKGYADGKRDAAPRWVRCEERLPDEAGEYIVAYHPRRWESINMEMKVGTDKYRDGKWAERNYRWVTHWMPLPEPPKEDA